MSNIFKEVLKDAQGVQEKLLGPTYPYQNNIKTPSEIGMSDTGSIKQMGKNIDGLIEYVELLVTGKSKASSTGGPLGNKFFLKTGGKCVDTATNKEVDRYIYINNVPQGNIPFISSSAGINFSEFKGLIPGAMGNLNVLNPFAILQSFLSGATPPCQELTMQVINNKNKVSSETHFVTVTDIRNIDPCSFPNKKNPVNKKKCRETFETVNAEIVMPEDPIAQIYFASLSIIGLYILHRLMEKSR